VDYQCANVKQSATDNCADRGGICFNSNTTCVEGRGGTYLPNLCGDSAACGCCIKTPSGAPTFAST
jgi:hypothetical protein